VTVLQKLPRIARGDAGLAFSSDNSTHILQLRLIEALELYQVYCARRGLLHLTPVIDQQIELTTHPRHFILRPPQSPIQFDRVVELLSYANKPWMMRHVFESFVDEASVAKPLVSWRPPLTNAIVNTCTTRLLKADPSGDLCAFLLSSALKVLSLSTKTFTSLSAAVSSDMERVASVNPKTRGAPATSLQNSSTFSPLFSSASAIAQGRVPSSPLISNASAPSVSTGPRVVPPPRASSVIHYIPTPRVPSQPATAPSFMASFELPGPAIGLSRTPSASQEFKEESDVKSPPDEVITFPLASSSRWADIIASLPTARTDPIATLCSQPPFALGSWSLLWADSWFVPAASHMVISCDGLVLPPGSALFVYNNPDGIQPAKYVSL
jgi:hypothetical protein